MFHRVLIAGMGAIGSEVAKNLGLLGCRSVFIVDPDVIESRNIGRSWLSTEQASTGKAKIVHAVDQLRRWFPLTHWEGVATEIADVDGERFAHAEALFSCVDTDLARTEIAALSRRYGLPVCDAGLGGTSTRMGRVSWFPASADAACFACLLTDSRRAALLSLWESDVHGCRTTENSDASHWTSTPTMASLVAALQVETATAVVSKDAEAFSLALDLDRDVAFQKIRHRRGAACPFHDDLPHALFPICVVAECAACGRASFPNRRIGWVRRRGACPWCGAHNLLVRESWRGELAESTR